MASLKGGLLFGGRRFRVSRARSPKASRSSSDKSRRRRGCRAADRQAPRRHGAHSAPPACSAAPASSRGTCAMRSANGCASALRNASAGARRCLSGQTRGRTPIAFLHPFCSQAKSWMRRNRDLQAVSPCRLPLITDALYCFQRQRTDEHDPILGSRARVADARTSPLVAPKALRRQLNSSGSRSDARQILLAACSRRCKVTHLKPSSAFIEI